MTRSQEAPYSILLFEDNSADADLVREYLELSPLRFELTVASRFKEGLKQLKTKRHDVVIVDLSLPDSSGLQTLRSLLEAGDGEAVVVLTGSGDEALSMRAMQAGAQDYLNKDKLDPEYLGRTIRHSVERAELLKRIERNREAVERNEAMLRQIFEANTEAMLVLSRKAQEIKFLNPAAVRLLDARDGELDGAVFPFELKSGIVSELELPGPKDSTKLVETSAVDVQWRGEDALLVVLRDITAHRKAELAYKREKERLSVTLDAIADAVIAIDGDGKVERINQEAARLLGTSNDEALGESLGAVLRLKHPKTGENVRDPVQLLLDPSSHDFAPELGLPLVDKNGEERLVSADMRCILDQYREAHGCVLVLRDLTAIKRAEDELFQNEKLHSISLLAGGIAHDFNNILTAVLGNISVVRVGMKDSDPLSAKLLAAEKAALQAKNLTRQLLTFSKGGAPVLETTTIDQVVEECTQFVLRGSNVRCDVVKGEKLWPVDADKGQIAQVINNLVINADQSMPDGGLIKVEIFNEYLKSDDLPGLPAGGYLRISVTDEGCGISPANLKRVFDPYFTTKEDGNGLGLASAYSIVSSHKGTMTVRSTVGQGTTFTIYLPRSYNAPAPPKAAEEPEEELHIGEGRILVMDDMEAMMLVAGEILKVLGYEVDFASDGQEAIDAYKAAKESGKPYDAVVFDLTVPGGMGGEEASEILIQYDPNLVAIASSGYTTSNVMSDYKNSAFKAVVPKPYRIKEMSAALRRALNA